MVYISGEPSDSALQKSLSFISEVESLRSKASAADVVFRDTDYFTAGELHQHYEVLEFIVEDFRKKDEFLQYTGEGVSIFDFLQPFKGQFKGKNYDSPLPPKMMFENNKICNEFDDFISNSILERVANGPLSIWGEKGECEPPHLVMPITTEPSKPRMCHDERFLNLWMKAPSISFDRLRDIP